MKINKTISALALGLGLAVGAQAQDDTLGQAIYITGSTAFRAQVYAGLVDLNLTVAQSGANGDSAFTFSGSIADHTAGGNNLNLFGLGGTLVTAYCSWSGSVEGVQAIIYATNAATYKNVDSGTFTFNGADLALSDVAQTSATQGNGPSKVDYTPHKTGVTLHEVQLPADASRPEQTGIAVQPFVNIVDGNAQTISNITSAEFFDLFNTGTYPMNFFTGKNSDSNVTVYAVGRYNLSGTRASTVTDNGGSFTANLSQYALSADGSTTPGLASTDSAAPPTAGNQWVSVGNNGYYSGGNVGKAIHFGSTNGAPPAIAYIGWADSVKLLGNPTNYEGPINFEGQVPWVGGTFPNSGGWNTNALLNGAYNMWTYERMYISVADQSTAFFDTEFGPALIGAIQYEIVHTPTGFGTVANNQRTAFLESEMSVFRSGDGGDVSPIH